jgi:RES domain-containing protein
LHAGKYAGNDPTGALLHEGRWNPLGTGAIYACNHPALATVEILANYAVLPTAFVLTEIRIPEAVTIEIVAEDNLPFDWNTTLFRQYKPYPFSAADVPGLMIRAGQIILSMPPFTTSASCQDFGFIWHHSLRSAVLSVPSAVLSDTPALARNFVINPNHPDFTKIEFLDPIPFTFDSRLK